MKKIFRFFVAGILAVLMSLSIVAFAACGNGDDVRDSITPEETEQLFSDSSYSALGVNGTLSMSGMTMNIDGKINLNGNMDIKMSAAGVPSVFKVYMRDWKIYMDEGTGLKGIVDLPDMIAMYVNQIGEEMLPVEVTSEMVSALLVSAKDVIPEAINECNAFLVSYGNAFNGITLTDEALTLDINKMYYNQMQELKSFVNGITAETTISDVLNSNLIKKMYGTLLNGSGAEFRTGLLEIITSLEGELEGEEAQIAILFKSLLNSVQPDSGSTVYDYIVKVASSSEFALILKSALELNTDLTDLTKLTLLDLVNLMGEEEEVTASQFNTVIAQYKQSMNTVLAGVTETSYDMGEAAVNNAKIVYNITNKAVSSQTISCTMIASTEAGKQQMDINVTVTYAKSAYTLDSISNLPEIDFNPGGSVTGSDLEGKTFESVDKEGYYVCFEEGKMYIEADGGVLCLGNYYVDGDYIIINDEAIEYYFNGETFILYSDKVEAFEISNHVVDISGSVDIGPSEPSNPDDGNEPSELAGLAFKLSYIQYRGETQSVVNSYMVFNEDTADMISESGITTVPYSVNGGVITMGPHGEQIVSKYEFDGNTLILHDYGYAGVDLYCDVYYGEINIEPSNPSEPSNPDYDENDPFNGYTFVITGGNDVEIGRYLTFKEGVCHIENNGNSFSYKVDSVKNLLYLNDIEYQYSFKDYTLYLFTNDGEEIILERK